ncbi:ArsR/SmtB family transcription factor [Streptomyces sp. Je 1-369]|uniref:ArsR/SmtB family transcription factor n=1 Tax=Streptomyces sp. Je 1-369 TaxID=2966192 RepID=UPI002285C92A|nr:winged helix-turn-helix domain-containing protein [Streptomyces sp. Je 1-369]WAL93423.1 winged helix-turn-helix domain-containing protein [Streptomyces sp. Je 1-369]
MSEQQQQSPPHHVLAIESPEQHAALAHPMRQRLLFLLGHHPATISQLAAQLSTGKGNVAHHLKVLRTAGLVHVAETRKVRGGTEQYYQRVAERMAVAEPRAEGTAAMLGAVAQELGRSERTTLSLRHVRLSPDKARELGETLARLVDEAEEDAEGEPVHGVLVALYEHARPQDAG